MPSPSNSVVNSLSDSLVVLVGAVALVSRPPSGVASWWKEVAGEIQTLYTDLRIYKALFELQLSGSALVGSDPPCLKQFSEALSACNDAVRRAVSQLSTVHSSDAHNAPGTPIESFHGNQEGGFGLTPILIQQRTELGHSFVLVWLDSLPKSSLIHAVATPLPPSPLSDTDLSNMQSDRSPLPQPKPSRGLFQPPPLSVTSQSPETSLSAALTAAEDVGKKWARRMGIQVDETKQLVPQLPLVLGSLFCVVLEDEPSSPTSLTPSIASLRSLICHTLLGMSEGITSIALLGTAGSGKSLLIDSLVGSRLLVPGEQTVLPCRIQHVPGLSTPKLNIVTEPFTFAVDELRRLRFTARCSEWNADRTARTLGRSDADASFKELWQAWLRLTTDMRPLLETIDQSGLEFYPVTTGHEAVQETLLNLESVIRLCRALNIFIPFEGLEWPVLQIEFKAFKDTTFAHPWEIFNLPGIRSVATADDLSLMDRLVLRGSTIVPVLNMAEQISDQKWDRFPKKLNELHIPVPYIIGPFLDATKSHDPDGQAFANEVAAMTWTTTENSEIGNTQGGSPVDRVLPCALVQGFSARYLLDALSLESTQGRPSWQAAQADGSDPTFWCIRHLFALRTEDHYNTTPTVKLDRSLRNILSKSKLDAVIGAIAQLASESPMEKGAKQLKYLKAKLLNIGQELDQWLVQAPSAQSTPPELSAGGLSATAVQKIIHASMNDLRTRATGAVDAALHTALNEMKKKDPPERSKYSTTPTFLEDSAEYMVPISALDPFIELSISYLQATLPELVATWFEEVTAAVALALPNHEINAKSPDSPSLTHATLSSATQLQDISINFREFTTFKTRSSQEPEPRSAFDSAHNPFFAISQLVWGFLRRMWWVLLRRPAGYRIPSEHATAVYMRVLGEPWLLDLESEAIAHVSSAREETVHNGPSETGLSEVFAIRYSIAAALAALE